MSELLAQRSLQPRFPGWRSHTWNATASHRPAVPREPPPLSPRPSQPNWSPACALSPVSILHPAHEVLCSPPSNDFPRPEQNLDCPLPPQPTGHVSPAGHLPPRPAHPGLPHTVVGPAFGVGSFQDWLWVSDTPVRWAPQRPSLSTTLEGLPSPHALWAFASPASVPLFCACTRLPTRLTLPTAAVLPMVFPAQSGRPGTVC